MKKIPGIWFPDIYEKVCSLPRIERVEKLNTVSKIEFDHFSRTSTPFVLKGAHKVQSEEEIIRSIRKNWGKHSIEIRVSKFKSPVQYVERKLEKLSVEEFLTDYWGKDNRFYAGNNPIDLTQSSAIGLEFPNFYPNEFFNFARMWLGPKGAITPLHKDIPDNFALNYFGKKRWIIFSPADFPYLYMTNPTPAEYPDLGVSQIDLANPDLDAFPDFAKASPIEVILDPGEMLYLPAGWGHYVENFEDSLLFNFWLLREKSPAVLGRDK